MYEKDDKTDAKKITKTRTATKNNASNFVLANNFEKKIQRIYNIINSLIYFL